MRVQILGIGWYREGDYPEILRIMDDAHVLPHTHREWRQQAERLECEYVRKGIYVVRAMIDPKMFPQWCRLRGLNVDAEARVAFANEEAFATDVLHGQSSIGM